MHRIRSIVARISRATGRIARLLGRLTTNTSGYVTVAAYLRAHGADEAWIARWGSAFGRRTAKAHRAATGTEPRTAWEITTKGLKRHMAYATTEHLDEAYTHYLGHKIAGPLLSATGNTARDIASAAGFTVASLRIDRTAGTCQYELGHADGRRLVITTVRESGRLVDVSGYFRANRWPTLARSATTLPGVRRLLAA